MAVLWPGAVWNTDRLALGNRISARRDDIPVPRHPTQLYEVIFHALAAIVLYATMDSKRFAGNKLKIYLIIYFAFRFFTEFLRPEPAILLGLTGYQWTSLALILILLILSPIICHPYTVDMGG